MLGFPRFDNFCRKLTIPGGSLKLLLWAGSSEVVAPRFSFVVIVMHIVKQ